MTDNVVKLRDGPLISDIPGMLRQLADAFERGDETAEGILVIVPVEGDWPDIHGYGEHLSDYVNIAVLDLAKTWLSLYATERSAPE